MNAPNSAQSKMLAIRKFWVTYTLKSSRNKKDLNDITAAPFWVFMLLAAEKDTENGAAVTSLKSFLFCDDFRDQENVCKFLTFYIEFAGYF